MGHRCITPIPYCRKTQKAKLKSESWVVFCKVQDQWQRVSSSAASSTQTDQRTWRRAPRTWCASGTERSDDEEDGRPEHGWPQSTRLMTFVVWRHKYWKHKINTNQLEEYGAVGNVRATYISKFYNCHTDCFITELSEKNSGVTKVGVTRWGGVILYLPQKVMTFEQLYFISKW